MALPETRAARTQRATRTTDAGCGVSVAELDRLLDVGSEEGSCSKASDEYDQPAQLRNVAAGLLYGVIQLGRRRSSTAPAQHHSSRVEIDPARRVSCQCAPVLP